MKSEFRQKVFWLLKMGLLLFGIVMGLSWMYYIFGNHNAYFSRSYYKEKYLRSLVFIEGHEGAIQRNYPDRYRELLEGMRWGSNEAKRAPKRYEKAIKRSEFKIRIVDLVRAFYRTRDLKKLIEAQRLYEGNQYKELGDWGPESGMRRIGYPVHANMKNVERLHGGASDHIYLDSKWFKAEIKSWGNSDS